MVYPYNGIFCSKKEWSIDICYNIDEPWKHYAKWKKSGHKKPTTVWQLLYEISRIGKPTVEDRLVDFPGGTVVKNPPAGLPWWRTGWESACQCRGHGFKPWSGRIPHAAERLGPWATIAEPARLEPLLRNKRGRDSDRPAHRNEEWPPLAATGESPHTETKTQHSQK